MKFIAFTLLFLLNTCCLATSTKLNLDFENIEGTTPKGWSNFGDATNYIQSLDMKWSSKIGHGFVAEPVPSL